VNPPETDRPRDTLPSVLRRNGVAMLIAIAATAAVQLGVWAWARAALAPPASTAMALFAAALWTLIAAAVFGAGGPGRLDGLLRAGAVIDASLALLIVLAAADNRLGWGGAAKVYVVLAAAGVALCGVARMGARRRGRCIAAAAAVIVLAGVCAMPLWTGGLVAAAGGAWRARLAWSVVAVNPFFAISGALAEAGFIWQERPLLYHYGVLGRDVPMPSVAWYVTAMLYAAAAAVAWAVACLIARRRPDRP